MEGSDVPLLPALDWFSSPDSAVFLGIIAQLPASALLGIVKNLVPVVSNLRMLPCGGTQCFFAAGCFALAMFFFLFCFVI